MGPATISRAGPNVWRPGNRPILLLIWFDHILLVCWATRAWATWTSRKETLDRRPLDKDELDGRRGRIPEPNDISLSLLRSFSTFNGKLLKNTMHTSFAFVHARVSHLGFHPSFCAHYWAILNQYFKSAFHQEGEYISNFQSTQQSECGSIINTICKSFRIFDKYN